MRLIRAIAAAVLALALTMNEAAAERRVALVLGNAAYQNVPALDNPVRDAKAMQDRLKSLGFEVVSGFDLTKAQTQAVLATFAKAVRGSDIALLFYAGHGMQVEGNNYLLPVDAALKDEISLDFEAVQVNFIWRQMARDTKVRLVFLDACRDNPLARVLAASGGSDRIANASSGLAEMQIEGAKTGGALIAFATSPGQVAHDGLDGHSPFTSALLAHLGDANVPLTTVMTRVTGDVFKATGGKQRPWVNVSLTDELTLNRTAPTAPTADAKPAAAGGHDASAPGAGKNEQVAIDQLRRLIPTIEADGPIKFDAPVKFGDAAIDGKSIAELIEGQPLYSPIEGLDKAEWAHPCGTCHQWTKERLCTQSSRYDKVDVSILRLQHPYGSRFKVALANWAKNGCK